MPVNLEDMVINLLGNTKSYERSLQTAISATKSSASTMSRDVNSIGSAWSGLAGTVGTTIAAIAGGASVIGTAFSAINLAGEAEQVTVALGTMLRSMTKGKNLASDIARFAAETPLETAGLLAATKTLLAFGAATEQNIIPTLRMLGDIAAGDNARLQSLALAFGQMSSAGRLMGQDLLQFINVGFNPLQIIAEQTGRSMGDLRKAMERGEISVEMVTKAFKSATSSGGQFFQLMEQQSKTFLGLLSTLRDNVALALTDIGDTIITEFNLKQLILDTASLIGEVASFFKDLSPSARRLLASLVAGAAAMTLLVGTTYALSIAWTAVAAISGPWFIALYLGTIWIAALIEETGGLAAAWERVTTAATAAWEWLAPVRQALLSFLGTYVATVFGVWRSFIGFINHTLASLNVSIDLSTIRETLVDMFLSAEYALLNFQRVWQTGWAALKYFAVAAINTILKNIFLILASPLLISMYAVSLVNWEKLWDAMLDYAYRITVAIGQVVFQLATALASITDPAKLLRAIEALKENILAITGEIKVDFAGIQIENLDKLEEQLKAEFEALRLDLVMDFGKFKAIRMSEFAAATVADVVDQVSGGIADGLPMEIPLAESLAAGMDAAVQVVSAGIDSAVRNIPKATSTALAKIEAVQIRSAEGRARLTDYLATISGHRGPEDIPGKQLDVLEGIDDKLGVIVDRGDRGGPIVGANLG